jgi:hypothetical protein
MSALIASASMLEMLNSPMTERPIAVVRGVAVTWSLAMLVSLLAQRRSPSGSFARLAFALVPIPLFPTFWLLLGERMIHGLPLEAFVRQESMCIVYALATPPSAAISLAMIGAFTIDSLILLWWVGPHSHVIAAQAWQPWTILLYCACAAVLTLYRAHGQRRELAVTVQAERMAAFERRASASLAARDLINTPLQTLTISLHLLASRYPEARDLTDAMGRSVERLHEVNHVLGNDAPKTGWMLGAESFDPVEWLRAVDEGAKP